MSYCHGEFRDKEVLTSVFQKQNVSLHYKHLYYPDLHYESPGVLWNAAFPKRIQLFEEQKHNSGYQFCPLTAHQGAFRIHIHSAVHF